MYILAGRLFILALSALCVYSMHCRKSHLDQTVLEKKANIFDILVI